MQDSGKPKSRAPLGLTIALVVACIALALLCLILLDQGERLRAELDKSSADLERARTAVRDAAALAAEQAHPSPSVQRENGGRKVVQEGTKITCGDIDVTFTRVAVERVRFVKQSIGLEPQSHVVLGEQPQTRIDLRIQNRTTGRRLHYTPWGMGSLAAHPDPLVDNNGNQYWVSVWLVSDDFLDYPEGIEARKEFGRLDPGGSLNDVILFDDVLPQAEWVDLDLPASNFGGDGKIQLRIPATMIQRR